MNRLALLLFVSALLSLSFSQGLGSNAYAHRLQPDNKAWHHHPQMKTTKEKMKVERRAMGEGEIEMNDYDDPRANVNPRGGGPLLNPSPTTPIPTPTPVTPPPNHSR